MLLCAKYVIPVTKDYIEDGAILVKEDKIVEVGKFDDLKKNQLLIQYLIVLVLL